MLGYVLGCAAWGYIKATAVGAHRTEHMLEGLGMPELAEELQYRVLGERWLAPRLSLGPEAARIAQSLAFGSAHENVVDAALGGYVYSKAFDAHGLFGSLAAHLAHNVGCWLGSK